MVMSNRYRTGTGSSSSFVLDQDEPQSSSENGPDSPLSGDDSRATATTPPLKKSRRSIQKRVVSVPIGDGDGGSRTKGDAYPPSDSWAWRKYGQKPIKGSPYPRGYYRCSSSKGCPARKQVERSRMDPTMLIITYACEHNHPLPTSKHHHHHHHNHQITTTAASTTPSATSPPTPSAPATTTSDDTPADSGDGADEPPSSPLIQINPFGEPPQLEFVGDALVLANLGVEYSWISDVSFNTPSFAGSTCVDAAEVAAFRMKEEDESLFGDLDELPECSTVFRRSHGSSIERCSATATPLCGSTG